MENLSSSVLITFFTAMFTILNPIGNVAIFSAMVSRRPPEERKREAIKSAIAIAAILVSVIWIGEYILKFFNVEIPSLQVAGGIMIGSVAISMLKSKEGQIKERDPDSMKKMKFQEIAIVPIAMPIVAGPGAIVTLIVNTHQYSGLVANLELSLICLALSAIIGACFLSSSWISRKVGVNGMNVVTKFMGMILLAIAASMLAEGVKALLPGLAG